jgi:signal transduction histidine kinase/CheY-like chemotaxis protein
VWAEVRQAILEHRRYQCEHRIVRPDGGERIVLEHAEPELDPATGRPVRFRGTVQDITERKRLEQELNEVRKMEALGHLASGVAHDFNNLLTVIQGHASLLEEQPTPNAEAADSWSQIRHAVERATRLTHQLATFSRRHPLPQSVLDFNSLVGQVARTVRSLLRQDIKLDCACAVGLPSVEGDPSLLEQVIKNLVLNAQDAMPVGGCLSIRTDRVVVDAQGAGRHPAARVGEFVCLSVQDTGGGIGPEVLPRIFEPFFTTKNGGVGTGLGLASAYAIVHRHRGWIEVETQLGSGTTVKVFLPAKPTVAPLPARPEGPVRARVGAGVILVVEDEEPLRVFVTLYLQRRGYTVVAAAGATPALEIWEREKDRVELLLTDVVMPGGMNGFELAQALLREKPSLKVLYTSGYTEQISGGPLLQEGANFLRKPYDANRLLTGVRRWLEAP